MGVKGRVLSKVTGMISEKRTVERRMGRDKAETKSDISDYC